MTVTCDETWIDIYEPKTKQQKTVWVFSDALKYCSLEIHTQFAAIQNTKGIRIEQNWSMKCCVIVNIGTTVTQKLI